MRETVDFADSLEGLKGEGLIQLVGVKLGDEEYAIDVLQIQEIIRPVDITIVPRLDSSVLGVMNLRGKVVPVIDLRTKFGMPKSDFDKSTRIVVVNYDKQNVGFVVDVVNAVIRISKDMVELTPPIVSNVSKEYILGICKFEDSLIIILDIYRLMNDDDEESNLRKLLLGKSQPKVNIVSPKVVDSKKSAEVAKPAPMAEVHDVAKNELPNPSLVQAPLIVKTSDINDIDKAIEDELLKRESETEELNNRKRSGGSNNNPPANSPSSPTSIDDMIAMELKKREEETEELNNRKRKGVSSNSGMDDILNDALNQSSNIFKDDGNHVDQNDLDSLIAKELAKREKETDELNRRNRESEKKK